jgi:hypothetical protein
MHPDTAVGTAGGPGDGDEQSFDTWRAFQKATDKQRANIIADIVGHPDGQSTVE